MPDEDLPGVREMYKTKHPKAYWVDFGDFQLMRMDTIKAMRFVGGFAMAGAVEPEGEFWKTELFEGGGGRERGGGGVIVEMFYRCTH